ncbi:MAG: hypothetical protein JW969_01080 [Spirochaetales bacterium]|nr:hypothetical protein [Spirochaetales bacterium]
MKKILLIGGIVIAVPIAVFLLFLGFSAATAYYPQPLEILGPVSTAAGEEKMDGDEVDLFTWNIGYAGLDALADFFLDGGTMGIARGRDAVLKNIEGITALVRGVQSDFYLFQEVDVNSNRSFHLDQLEVLAGIFPAYPAWFAVNYRVAFVPVPLSSPMGDVYSGLLSFSRYRAEQSVRYQLPGEFPFPQNLYQLKRCANFITFESPFKGKKLIVVNVHLSAYDEGGFLRQQELDFLKEKMQEFYTAGHFVILGGDWNNLFPGVMDDLFTPYTTDQKYLFWVQRIPQNWTPAGWTWAYDSKIPTVRTDEKPYVAGENYTTIIDGFLLSPNVELLEAKGYDLGFKHSDHNPVSARVRLKG